MKTDNSGFYVWFDTEYSTLDLESARLLQVAALITDFDLRRVVPREKDISVAIRLAAGDDISPWVRENLPGLVRKCLSPDAVDLSTADDMLSAYVDSVLGGPADLENERRSWLESVNADCRLPEISQFKSRLNFTGTWMSPPIQAGMETPQTGKDIGRTGKNFIRRYYRKQTSGNRKSTTTLNSMCRLRFGLAFYRSNPFSK